MIHDLAGQMATVATLSEPLRRSLYLFVAAQPRPVSRAAAAAAMAVPRTVAAFHLDKLVEAGLLSVEYGRTSARRGPGSGRPAKLYARAERQHQLSIPPRSYELAARLLGDAVEQAGADQVLYAVAQRQGERLGAELAAAQPGRGDELQAAVTALGRCGYEPARLDDEVRLRNCPFHELSQHNPPLICGMNLALLTGLVAGLGLPDLVVRMDPRPGECCVTVSKSKPG